LCWLSSVLGFQGSKGYKNFGFFCTKGNCLPILISFKYCRVPATGYIVTPDQQQS
jgi:hypothetical protein